MITTFKLRCESVTPWEHGGGEHVVLTAVTTGEGNESWSKWTPSGTFAFDVTNPAVIGTFAVGKEYLFTARPADAATERQ